MFDGPHSTSVPKDVLIRLIAAARVTDTVTWAEAQTEAENNVASLWGDRTPGGPPPVIEVSTDVLLQLSAAADAALGSAHAGSSWPRLVEHDVSEVVHHVVGAAAAERSAPGREPGADASGVTC